MQGLTIKVKPFKVIKSWGCELHHITIQNQKRASAHGGEAWAHKKGTDANNYSILVNVAVTLVSLLASLLSMTRCMLPSAQWYRRKIVAVDHPDKHTAVLLNCILLPSSAPHNKSHLAPSSSREGQHIDSWNLQNWWTHTQTIQTDTSN